MARRRRRKQIRKKPSVGLISLGCAKNLVDSERILGRLGASGFPVCFDPDEADVVLVNTCGFIGEAVLESTEVLTRQLARKEKGACKVVIALGCLPSRLGARGRLPGVDGWFGIADLKGIERFLHSLSRPGKASLSPGRSDVRPSHSTSPLTAEGERLRLTPSHWSYLRITEGCDNRCRYCTIPMIRGPLRCKPLAEIAREAEELVGSGARELILIGQDTAAWRDRNGAGLSRVIERLVETPDLSMIRVMYAHPAHVDPALIRMLAFGPPVLPYLDLPIQHAAGSVLGAMGRPTSPEDLRNLVERLREEVPGMVLRTTVMVGFPGEGKAEFRALLRFLSWARFERIGAFRYSPEEGTEATELPDRVEEGEARRRLKDLLSLAERIRDEYHQSRVGGREVAVVDWREGEWTVCRTGAEAPEVDPVLLNPGHGPAGKRGIVRITGLRGPDLTAEWV